MRRGIYPGRDNTACGKKVSLKRVISLLRLCFCLKRQQKGGYVKAALFGGLNVGLANLSGVGVLMIEHGTNGLANGGGNCQRQNQ